MTTANTETILNTLKRFNVDPNLVSNLKSELDKNKAADGYLDKAVTRTNQFNEYVTKKDREVQELQTKIKELATLHDVSKTSSLDEGMKKAVLEKIALLEDALIETGQFNEDEVRNLSFAEKQILTKVNDDVEKANIKKVLETKLESEEDEEMPNSKQYLEKDELTDIVQNTQARTTLAGISINNKIFKKIRQYEKLAGKEADEKLIDGFEDKVLSDIMANSGKDIDEMAEEHFKISELQTARQSADLQRQLKEAEEKGAREALKREGVVPRQQTSRFGRGTSPVYARKRFGSSEAPNQESADTSGGDNKNLNANSGEMVELNNGKKVPINKDGIPEYYRGRGDRSDRVERASEKHGQIMDKLGSEGLLDLGFGE